ncbi:hypothetical protein K493DRAFT_317073 [Basidiobolus meristosporus CBS 931.73]|uniref:Uncharacterized protein n=1 Tax=Basidiobolus meristosporus CBS 931.73 TaxID=1314790 RepID=A0A1Y1Y1U5_9FUNG|nr:hypothetical protein K493DRAFT_317073 [Basidiobolus meristosporus CBS 931.73]|eukprot:ORX91696.1 hypothetical protein K493DRAFT_317073 [Basidiobolus meristosporus CBS 931.73]
MTIKPTVLVSGTLEHASELYEELSSEFNFKFHTEPNREMFIKNLKEGYYDDLFAILFIEFEIIERFDHEIFSLLPDSLKLIAIGAAGYDNVDLEEATSRGIWVTNVPGGACDSTAEIAVHLILSACRQTYQAEQLLRKGLWRDGIQMGMDMKGKKLGILGMGKIGKSVARRALGFDVEIFYHNRQPLSKSEEELYQATYLPLDEFLATIDILSINAPLNKDNCHLINEKSLQKMKDNVVIVNTGRGKIIEEAALVSGLKSGKIFAAGLDVYENEPMVDPYLLSCDRVTLLPHIGWQTTGTFHRFEATVLNILNHTYTHGRPESALNEL